MPAVRVLLVPGAEVDGPHRFVCEQVRGRPLQDDAARAHHRAAVGVPQRQPRVLLHQQDGHALRAQRVERREDLGDDQRREPERGLVEQQQLRLGHERPGDGQHLLLAAAERLGRLVGALLQHGEQRAHALQPALDDGAPLPAGAVRAQLEVVAHGHGAEEQAALGHEREPVAHQALGPRRAHLGAVVADRARAQRHEPDDRLEQRRLAGAVGADDGHELAGADGEVHVVQHLGLAVAGADRLQLEQRRAGGRRRGRRVRHRRPPPRPGRRR